jgi:hypothetical protein
MRLTQPLTRPLTRRLADLTPSVLAVRSGVAGPQAETTALLAAMTVQPSAGRKTLIDNMILALKSAGIWTTLDFLYVLAAHDAQAGRINWINPAQVMTVVTGTGPPTFTTDRGYLGVGTGYLSTAVNWSALAKYTQSDAAIGAWVQNDATAGTAATAVMGCLTTNNRISMTPRVVTTNALAARINGATASGNAIVSSRGHSLANRTGAAGIDAYKDGSLLGNTVIASVAVIAEEIVMFKNGATFNTVNILSAAHAGSSLSGGQITSLNNALTAYMTGVGA